MGGGDLEMALFWARFEVEETVFRRSFGSDGQSGAPNSLGAARTQEAGVADLHLLAAFDRYGQAI